MKTIHIEIYGKVQGVYYRASAREIALNCRISGWIRNDYSGKVEALVTGSEADLEKFITWCWEGPSRASVEKVDTREVTLQHFDTFEVLR
ncbi:MAG: acylphosphatase [Bacteroidota bacterium]|nr:acylphosphatase [Bacteroidota bacterium]